MLENLYYLKICVWRMMKHRPKLRWLHLKSQSNLAVQVSLCKRRRTLISVQRAGKRTNLTRLSLEFHAHPGKSPVRTYRRSAATCAGFSATARAAAFTSFNA